MNRWRKSQLFLAKLLHLDLTHAQRHYAMFINSCVKQDIYWLEVGCGRHIVPYWAMPAGEQSEMVSRCASLTGLDVDNAINEHALLTNKVRGLAGSSPFRDGLFDLVSANMVAEHVKDCSAFLQDIFRILKPGGRFVFHTPNLKNYLVFLSSRFPDHIKGQIVDVLEPRREAERFFTYYHMNTVKRIRRLAEESGFQIEELRVVGSDVAFGRFGPLGVLECFVMKMNDALSGGKFNPNLIGMLRKPPADDGNRCGSPATSCPAALQR